MRSHLIRVSEKNYLRLRRLRMIQMEKKKKDISFNQIIEMLLNHYENQIKYRF